MISVGVDIAKDKLDVAVIDESGQKKHRVFTNNQKGFDKLLKWIHRYEKETVHICMEATSTYGFKLARYLCEANYSVSIVNPLQVKAYGQSELKRNKTDKIDAELIARFCIEKQPRLWQPPSAHRRDLQALFRRIQQYKDMLSQEKNRLHSADVEVARLDIEDAITHLEDVIDKLEKKVLNLIEDNLDLKQNYDLLNSIDGIGFTTACLLLAEIDFSVFSTVEQLVAFAGLNPKHNTSGTFVGKTRISKQGSPRLRKILFMAAKSAIRFNPIISSLAIRLQHKGHSYKSVICAAMRKLLLLAFGVLKSNTPFDPTFHEGKPYAHTSISSPAT